MSEKVIACPSKPWLNLSAYPLKVLPRIHLTASTAWAKNYLGGININTCNKTRHTVMNCIIYFEIVSFFRLHPRLIDFFLLLAFFPFQLREKFMLWKRHFVRNWWNKVNQMNIGWIFEGYWWDKRINVDGNWSMLALR